MILILLKIFKTGSMKTGCFTKMFYFKKDESWIQRMNKKDSGKDWKSQKNIYIYKNKETEGTLCEVGQFYTVQGIF